MKKNKILVIIQRSNGDVFFSGSLINNLKKYFLDCQIDLLINDDTIQIAKIIPGINKIINFSYKKKDSNRWKQEREIFKKIYRKYNLAINLTASDRSVLYSIIAANKSVSAVEEKNAKSWWKKLFLTHFYTFDTNKHIIENNLKPLEFFGIKYEKKVSSIPVSRNCLIDVSNKLKNLDVENFLIFHPSSQYNYKIYPQEKRNKLLNLLEKLEIPIIVSGGNSKIDLQIKDTIPKGRNIINLIGETSIEEFIGLSHLSMGYIGMDTLNMHIAASQNKRVFAIFGPTNLKMWSPWSNISMSSTNGDSHIHEYENITIFQADFPCVPCGKAGCNDRHDESLCLNHIDPELVYRKVRNFINDQQI